MLFDIALTVNGVDHEVQTTGRDILRLEDSGVNMLDGLNMSALMRLGHIALRRTGVDISWDDYVDQVENLRTTRVRGADPTPQEESGT